MTGSSGRYPLIYITHLQQIPLRWNTQTNGNFEECEHNFLEKFGKDVLVMSGYYWGKIGWAFWSRLSDPTVLWHLYDLYIKFTETGLSGFYAVKESR